MTNEQLAVLLKSIAVQVSQLAVDVESLIDDGPRETERVWVGEGKEPHRLSIESIEGKGYEFQPVGEFSAVAHVKEFERWLLEQVYELNGKEKAAMMMRRR